MASGVDSGRFQSAQDANAERFNIVWASQGFAGSGKTHFLLTAPDPIYYFQFDPAGLKGLVDKKQFKKREILVANYCDRMNLGRFRDTQSRVAACLDVLNDFREDYEAALKAGRTIGFDKEDSVWEMLRLATNEDYSVEPKKYQDCNTEFTGWINSAENAGVNLGLLRGMKEDWGQTGVSSRTGKVQYGGLGTFSGRGCKLVPELVQIQLNHALIAGTDDNKAHFSVTVLEKCRLGNALELVGKEFRNPTFLDVATELYPNARPDVWGL